MNRALKTKYLAGLWEFELQWQLLWKVGAASKGLPSRHSIYVAPTWSWASLMGPINFAYYLGPRFAQQTVEGTDLFTIQDVHIETIDGHDMSSIAHGYLRVIGGLIAADVNVIDEAEEFELHIHFDYHSRGPALDHWTPLKRKIVLSPDVPSEITQGTYYFVPIYLLKRLVLMKDGEAKGTFRRVGIYDGGPEARFLLREMQKGGNLLDKALYENYHETTGIYTLTIV